MAVPPVLPDQDLNPDQRRRNNPTGINILLNLIARANPKADQKTKQRQRRTRRDQRNPQAVAAAKARVPRNDKIYDIFVN